jgi:hypothetical protein
MTTENKATTNKPDYFAYVVTEREGRDAFWDKIGMAYKHKDGKGLNVQLQSLPIDGRISLREPSNEQERTNATR